MSVSRRQRAHNCLYPINLHFLVGRLAVGRLSYLELILYSFCGNGVSYKYIDAIGLCRSIGSCSFLSVVFRLLAAPHRQRAVENGLPLIPHSVHLIPNRWGVCISTERKDNKTKGSKVVFQHTDLGFAIKYSQSMDTYLTSGFHRLPPEIHNN